MYTIYFVLPMSPIVCCIKNAKKLKKKKKKSQRAGEPPRTVGVGLHRVILNDTMTEALLPFFSVNGYKNHKLDAFFKVKKQSFVFLCA